MEGRIDLQHTVTERDWKQWLEDQKLDIIERYSCWICQEEMSSESFLLQHYENHNENYIRRVMACKVGTNAPVLGCVKFRFGFVRFSF